MDAKEQEVEKVEVSAGVIREVEPARNGVAEGEQEVARVIEVSSDAPEAGGEQFAVDDHWRLTPDILAGVGLELVFLAIRAAEDEEAGGEA